MGKMQKLLARMASIFACLDSDGFTKLLLFSSFLLLSCLVFIIYMGFPYSNLYFLMIDNGDGLLIEDIARGLVAGYSLFDWRLTQAPYLFPDIMSAWILVLAGIGVGKVSIAYQWLYGIALVIIWSRIVKRMHVDQWAVLMFVVLLYAHSYLGDYYSNFVSKYFGLLGFHSGVSLIVILGALQFDSLTKDENNIRYLDAVLLFLVVSLGVASESLVLLAFVLPALMYLGVIFFKREITVSSASLILGTLVLSVFSAKCFNLINPFPQDKAYLTYFLSRFPDLTSDSIHLFIAHLRESTRAMNGLFWTVIFGLASYFICLLYIYRYLKSSKQAHSMLLLMCFISVFGFSFCFFSQHILGVYVGVDSSRQWAGILFVLIITAFCVFSNLSLAHGSYSRMLLFVLVALSLIFTTHFFTQNEGKIRRGTAFEPLIACMEKEFPKSSQFISDYWLARPVNLYSNRHFLVAPYNMGNIFTISANIFEVRKMSPQFAITGYGLTEEQLIRQYGAPLRKVCNIHVPSYNLAFSVLDYSNNPIFITDMKKISENAN